MRNKLSLIILISFMALPALAGAGPFDNLYQAPEQKYQDRQGAIKDVQEKHNQREQEQALKDKPKNDANRAFRAEYGGLIGERMHVIDELETFIMNAIKGYNGAGLVDQGKAAIFKGGHFSTNIGGFSITVQNWKVLRAEGQRSDGLSTTASYDYSIDESRAGIFFQKDHQCYISVGKVATFQQAPILLYNFVQQCFPYIMDPRQKGAGSRLVATMQISDGHNFITYRESAFIETLSRGGIMTTVDLPDISIVSVNLPVLMETASIVNQHFSIKSTNSLAAALQDIYMRAYKGKKTFSEFVSELLLSPELREEVIALLTTPTAEKKPEIQATGQASAANAPAKKQEKAAAETSIPDLTPVQCYRSITDNQVPHLAIQINWTREHQSFLQLVCAGGPGDKAGLQKGDILLTLNGKTVNNRGDIQTAVSQYRFGDTIPVEIFRDGKQQTIQVLLPTRDEVVAMLLIEAQKGNAEAQNSLGFMYDYGKGAAQDQREAFKWYKLAADQGDALGKCNLVGFYATGTVVIKDLPTAKRLAQEGIDAGENACQKVWDRYHLANVQDAPPAAAPVAVSIEDKLTQLKSLLQKGLITQDEYDAKRKKIIDGM